MNITPTEAQSGKPRLLLIGAGETEIGRAAPDGWGTPDLRGAVLPWLLDALLPPCMGSLFSNERCYEIAGVVKFDRLPVFGRRRLREGLRTRDEEKAQRALLLTDLKGLDGAVILIDRENKRLPDRAARLRRGRDSHRHKAGSPGPACAIGSCCRSVETWLLADHQARTSVFGQDALDPFSGDPEDRPSPRELKRYIETMAKGKGAELPDVYEDLAKAARPDELRSRCRTSYPPFADDVDKEIGPLIRSEGA